MGALVQKCVGACQKAINAMRAQSRSSNPYNSECKCFSDEHMAVLVLCMQACVARWEGWAVTTMGVTWGAWGGCGSWMHGAVVADGVVVAHGVHGVHGVVVAHEMNGTVGHMGRRGR